jgi:hypothetical protein
MGGDGGTIGSTRRFLRGVGAANTTADATRYSAKELEEHKHDQALQALRTCSLTGSPLNFQSTTEIVACDYGRLYNRESAVEALLRRKQSSSTANDGVSLGGHIRGLRDLYPVRFQTMKFQEESSEERRGSVASGESSTYVPVCPVTGTILNGAQPAFLLVTSSQSKKNRQKSTDDGEQDRPNVISERAIKEIGIEALQSDFGPFDSENMIRLAPPTFGPEWESIQTKVQQKLMQQQERKKGNSTKRKQQLASANTENLSKKKRGQGSSMKDTIVDLHAVEVAKANARSAIASSAALSSLFVERK